MATFSAQGTLPASGAEIVAEPLADTFTHIINTLNGNNLDENNVDYTSTDGIATLQNAQTFSAAKTFSADVTLSGGDGALTFGAAGSVKIPDNEATSLVIEEADNAYLTFVTTNSGEKIVSSQAIEVGVDGTGHDVKLFGDTSGQYMLWDQSADELVLAGDTKLSFHDAAGGENIIASSDGHLEVNAGTTLDITAPTVDLNSATEFNIDTAAYDLNASGAVTIDSAGVSIDSSSASNLTTSSGALTLTSAAAATWSTAAGALTLTSAAAATWSTSAGALTVNGAGGVNIQEGGADIVTISDARALATANTASINLDASGVVAIESSGGTISVGDDNVDQTINLATKGTRTLNVGINDGTDVTTLAVKGNTTNTGTITVGEDDTGYDVKLFGATAGKYLLWDEDADALLISGDIDMVAHNNRIDLDADNDTSIRASADDTISIEVAGADDFTITANSFNVLTGSIIDLADNATVTFGDGDDATIKWDASNLEVSAGTAAVNVVAGDLTLYDDNNAADVSLTMGTGSAESFSIIVDNGGSNKTAEEIKLTSKTASGTTDHGKIGFYVDEVKIGTFDDGGLDLESGMVFSVNGTTIAEATVGSIANGADNRIATFSDSDSLNGEANLTFNGSALQVTGTVTVGVDDTGHDVKFFGATSGKYMLWDEDADSLLVSGDIDMVANGNKIDLDADNDTSIRASADDTITIEVAGADDFSITANSLNVLSGSVIDLADNAPVQFGDADDASIKFDTANLVYNTAGYHSFTGGDVHVGNGQGLVIGHTAQISPIGTTSEFQVLGTSETDGSAAICNFADNNNGAVLTLGKARGGAIGTYTVVQDDDKCGAIYFGAADGTDLNNRVASIVGLVDGTPGGNDTPGRLTFSTTSDGAGSPSERMRINNNGNVFIGDTANSEQTRGLTIHMDGNDDNILDLKAAEVAHGRTSHGETDTFFSLAKYDANKGGCLQYVLMDNEAQTPCYEIRTTGGQATTNKTEANCFGLMQFRIAQHDGSNAANGMTADGVAFAIRCTNNGGDDRAIFAVDEDGDVFAGNGTAMTDMSDDKNDPALLRGFDHAVDELGLAKGMIKNRWDDFVKTRDQDLVELGVLGDTVENGGLYCVTQHTRLMNSAIWQVYSMLLDVIDSLPTETQNKIRQVVPNQLLLEVA